MTSWTQGDVSGGTALTDSDHLYPIHINELRGAVDTTDTTVGTIQTSLVDLNESSTVVKAISPYYIYTVGDSLTQWGQYQTTLQTLLGSWWDIINKGASGAVTTAMSASVDIDVVNWLDAKYAIIWGGINDVAADVSAATIETNLQTMYTACHNAGIKVIALNITPIKTSAQWSSGRQTVLDAVNTWIASTATNIDYNIDIYSLLEDPANPDTLLPAYAYADYYHLSQAGFDVVANAIYTGTTWTKSSPYPVAPRQWSTFTPNFTNLTVGNGTLSAKYYRVGAAVDFRIDFRMGTSSSISSYLTFDLPVGGELMYPVTASIPILGNASFYNGTTIFKGVVSYYSYQQGVVLAEKSDATYTTLTLVDSVTPFTWASGNELYIQGRYELPVDAY